MRFVTFETKRPSTVSACCSATAGSSISKAAIAARLARDVPLDRALALAHAMAPPDARDFIANGRIALDAARAGAALCRGALAAARRSRARMARRSSSRPAQCRLKAPVPRPRKFIAAGKNYFAHQQEMQQRADPNAPQVPIAHVQFASTVIGPDETVHSRPRRSTWITRSRSPW